MIRHLYSDHPNRLPPDEENAVLRQVTAFNREANRRGILDPIHEWPMPATDYDLIERALSHWPAYDPETGAPIVHNVVFVDHAGRMMFKNASAIRLPAE